MIEQPGPWGRNALTDSHLDPELGRVLTDATAGTGTRILLARHPDRLERRHDGGHRVWIAHTAPGTSRLRQGTTADLGHIAEWDFAAMAAGSLPEFGAITNDPVLFVCTHSGRDACCALHGRQLTAELHRALSADDRARIWECSHLGGHRFAPTALALPSGNVYGRLDLDSALAIRAAEAEHAVELPNYRGRSSFPAPMQAAEAAVRATGVIDRDVLDVLWVRGDRAIPVLPGVMLDNIASMLAEVRHVDGRSWRVTVRQQPLARARNESCGAEPVASDEWIVATLAPAPNWG